jgi:hypothetical protein
VPQPRFAGRGIVGELVDNDGHDRDIDARLVKITQRGVTAALRIRNSIPIT